MDRNRIIIIVAAVVAAAALNVVYQSTIIYWDGFGLEVNSVFEVDPELVVTIEESDLTGYSLVEEALDAALGGESVFLDDFTSMNQFEALLEEKGMGLDRGVVYVVYMGEPFSVNVQMFGGMDSQPIYLYLSWLMIAVAVVVAALTLLKR